MASLAAALQQAASALPRIAGFLVIVIAGWLAAAAIGKLAAAVLRRLDFNGLARRAGLEDFITKTGVKTDAAGFIGDVARWFVRLVTLVVGFDALNLPAVSRVLSALVMWLPNLAVALVALVAGGIAARAIGGLARGAAAKAELERPQLFATITETSVWGFGIVVALHQLGVAPTLVDTLFTGVVSALAIALGLAFGLGGRETAAEIVRSFYAKGRRSSRLAAAATMEERRTRREPGRTKAAARAVIEQRAMEREEQEMQRVAEELERELRREAREACRQGRAAAGVEQAAAAFPGACAPRTRSRRRRD